MKKNSQLNRGELIKILKEETSIASDKEARRILNLVLGAITSALEIEGRVALRNFGSFEVIKRNPRIGRHPASGAKIHIRSRNIVQFVPSQRLKDRIANLEVAQSETL